MMNTFQQANAIQGNNLSGGAAFTLTMLLRDGFSEKQIISAMMDGEACGTLGIDISESEEITAFLRGQK